MNSPENFKGAPGIKEKYAQQVDSEGYLRVNCFAVQELHVQSKTVAALLDGDEGTMPEYNLGKGLRYRGGAGNYSEMKIHIDDLETFIDRVRTHYGG